MKDGESENLISAIGQVKSPFKEKFAIPRQPNLTPSVISEVVVPLPFGTAEAFEGIEEFSHIWLLFRFHHNLQQGWKPQVRPPRLGGNQKKGVFATRSSFRPNGFGISVVPLVNVATTAQEVRLQVSGLDLADGTPIYDIKPYIAYVDAIPNAHSGFAPDAPQLMAVHFTTEALCKLKALSSDHKTIEVQVKEVLAQDPRPAYRKQAKQDAHQYGTSFDDFNFRWQVIDNKIEVFEVNKA
ncbi:tRNA (N6-threonylcarbamoyladenosine(37)-N6)-methyltransferase TrmO [Planctobacterium marinum]|uniref:tRNA (N6-threonylcarbamoyladenosine(37)-N6)-methyltransferase TrmO n=1 Tax=Planctobacterium marinum TaxID=1631968 RepID=UPI0030C6F253